MCLLNWRLPRFHSYDVTEIHTQAPINHHRFRWTIIIAFFPWRFHSDIPPAYDWLLPFASSHDSQSHLPILPVTYDTKWRHIRQARYERGCFSLTVDSRHFQALNRNGNNFSRPLKLCLLQALLIPPTCSKVGVTLVAGSLFNCALRPSAGTQGARAALLWAVAFRCRFTASEYSVTTLSKHTAAFQSLQLHLTF